MISLVLLSFGIPFALISLVRLTSDDALMGDVLDRRLTSMLGWLVTGPVAPLNMVLIFLTLTTHPG